MPCFSWHMSTMPVLAALMKSPPSSSWRGRSEREAKRMGTGEVPRENRWLGGTGSVGRAGDERQARRRFNEPAGRAHLATRKLMGCWLWKGNLDDGRLCRERRSELRLLDHRRDGCQ